ncbi:MAG: hypothetical protein HOP12_01320 [Candidatus Eisenbacteria bacterium]|uniref:Rhamnogalacturonan lyase domain-containing protein n=1 Tax=Eiseniibacteriota bacterium TaxID=2212470 RepID=A0A849SIS8_UNCEI|nr:hypothetical protein [Candidatus Eisenbacteria bacterium]
MTRRRFDHGGWSAAIAVLAIAWSSVPAHAAVLSGFVHTPNDGGSARSTANAYAGRANSLPGRHETRVGAVTDAVIYFEETPAGTLPENSDRGRTLAQRDQAFVPRVLAIPVGAAVDFPNMDPIFHNVFSVSPACHFDLGKYPKGRSRQVTFRKAGVVNVYCDIHSSMAAWIVVVAHPWFTRPAADGSFALPDVPPGSYRVVAWHPDLPTVTREVTIPAGGATVELRF